MKNCNYYAYNKPDTIQNDGLIVYIILFFQGKNYLTFFGRFFVISSQINGELVITAIPKKTNISVVLLYAVL